MSAVRLSRRIQANTTGTDIKQGIQQGRSPRYQKVSSDKKKVSQAPGAAATPACVYKEKIEGTGKHKLKRPSLTLATISTICSVLVCQLWQPGPWILPDVFAMRSEH